MNSNRRCHHCGRYEHIRLYCFILYGYPQSYRQPRPKRKGKKTHVKKVWKSKETVKCLLAQVPLRVSSKKDWYFDSGCSHHMIGERSNVKDLNPYSNSYVTFGDETRGRIKGIGKLVSLDLPCLYGVLLVEGLLDNLINISQLCD